MAVIRVENLSYIYSQGTPFEKVAVNNVSLEIAKGEFVGVIGHTGSGKSTLIQHFNGLLRPTEGKVYVNGQDIWGEPSKIRKFRFEVGLVFQYPEYQLFEETVYKDIAFGPGNMGLSAEEIDHRVWEAAEFAGIPKELMQKSPFELSGGQKRRVAIAGVLAMRPQVLILDEPTAGLDPFGREQILGQISRYHQAVGNTVLLVSHSMEDVANFAQKVLVMNEAEVFAYDDLKNVFAKAEEMVQMGLAVPQITRICMELHKKGYPIRQDIYTVEDAKNAILALLQKGGAHHA